jgi:hypothetical protein
MVTIQCMATFQRQITTAVQTANKATTTTLLFRLLVTETVVTEDTAPLAQDLTVVTVADIVDGRRKNEAVAASVTLRKLVLQPPV